MTPAQIAVVAITFGLCALDGFDVLAVSFAAPGIAREWGIDRAALGFVLSMELVGMVIGSVLVGGLADRIGRRRTMLGCLAVMTLGMAMATSARSVGALSAWRVITGIGIGGMVPTISAVAAEFANVRRRDLCVSLMAIGYPVGAVVGGSISALLLRHSEWRAVFAFGAIVTALWMPVVLLWVPESVSWLCQRRPAQALQRVNLSLAQLGYRPVAVLPAVSMALRVPVAAIWQRDLRMTTVLTTLAYFLHVTSYYFVVKWVPKFVVDMGFAPAAAAGVLVWASVGGATGGMALGLLAQRFGVKALTLALMLASSVMLAVFGAGWTSLQQLSQICALTGFCTHGALVGMYVILTRAYPAATRGTGTGFVVGVGRGGAVLAPIVAGVLFRAGHSLQFVAVLMGAGSMLAAVALGLLRVKPPELAATE